CASASEPPRQRAIETAARATNAVITAMSSAAAERGMPPIQYVDVTPSAVIAAAVVDGTSGTSRLLARAMLAYSIQPTTRSSSATARKSSGGANHTTATAKAMRTAPLTTRVTPRRAPPATA